MKQNIFKHTPIFRETDEELGFMEAVHTCIGYHYSKTPFQGLIPVGRLRCIRNRFKSTSGDDVCGRFFRVNAIKDNRGVWREHPSGQRVEFHHYPEFDPLHGSAGDTLIWDAFLNRLYIDDQHDHYNAMCYRDYENGIKSLPSSQTTLFTLSTFQIVKDAVVMKMAGLVPTLEIA